MRKLRVKLKKLKASEVILECKSDLKKLLQYYKHMSDGNNNVVFPTQPKQGMTQSISENSETLDIAARDQNDEHHMDNSLNVTCQYLNELYLEYMEHQPMAPNTSLYFDELLFGSNYSSATTTSATGASIGTQSTSNCSSVSHNYLPHVHNDVPKLLNPIHVVPKMPLLEYTNSNFEQLSNADRDFVHFNLFMENYENS